MKKTILRTTFYISLLILLTGFSAIAIPNSNEAVLKMRDVPDEKSARVYFEFDGSVYPTNSPDPALEPTITGTPNFYPGVRGEALSLSANDVWITFASTELINPDRGSIAFWTKLVDWDFSDTTKGTYFFCLLNESLQHNAYMYKYPAWANRITLIYDHSKYDTLDYSPTLPHLHYSAELVMNTGEWHHVVMTWSGRAIAFYTDGTLVWKQEMRDPFERSEHGHGLTFAAYGENQTLIDEFTIFDYPLADAEVANLYNSYETIAQPTWPKLTPCRVDVVYYPMVEKVRCTAAPRTDLLGSVATSERFYAMDPNIYELELGEIKVDPAKNTAVGEFDLPAVASSGLVSIKAELLDQSGNVLYTEVSEPFEKRVYPWQDEAKDVGLTNAVIDPFTPLEVHNDSVYCWGREYRLGLDGLPAHIVSRQASLLSEPLSLTASNEGGPVAVTAGDFIFTNKTEGVVNFTSDLRIGNLPVKVRGTIEYDGMIRYDLVFDENASKYLTDLTLRMVIPNEHAVLYHVNRYCIRHTNEAGSIPSGTGKVWGSSAKKSRRLQGVGYERVREDEDLLPGAGYWILLDQNQSYTLNGKPLNDYTLSVENGWYMIGGCISSARASVNIGSIIVIYIYAAGAGYQRVKDTEKLEPENGYWILFKGIINQAELKVYITESEL